MRHSNLHTTSAVLCAVACAACDRPAPLALDDAPFDAPPAFDAATKLDVDRCAFGQTFMQQTSLYGHTYGTSFHSPNFADIAKACGAEGIRVTEPGDVEEALRRGLAATKRQPALVEVMVGRGPYPKL